MKRDDAKFLTGLILTLVLAGLVVYAGWKRDLRLAQGPVVDVERIQTLIQQGRLSFREAEFYEEVKEKKEKKDFNTETQRTQREKK